MVRITKTLHAGFMNNMFGKNDLSENKQAPVITRDIDLESNKMGSAGSNYVVISLKFGDKILSSPSSLIYMKGDVEKGEISIGKSVIAAFSRAFAGEDMVMTSYKGGNKGGKVAFSSDIPGDIIKIKLQNNETYTISRTSFLCGSENIHISATVQPLGILGIGSGEGFILPTIKANGGAVIWLAAFGSFERIELKTNEEIIIDNGIFLAAPSFMKYTLVKLGKSYISSFLGGEGFGMRFVGPGIIYTQSKNLNNFGQMMSRYISSVDKPQSFDNAAAIVGAVGAVGAVANAFMGDGGKNKTKENKINDVKRKQKKTK